MRKSRRFELVIVPPAFTEQNGATTTSEAVRSLRSSVVALNEALVIVVAEQPRAAGVRAPIARLDSQSLNELRQRRDEHLARAEAAWQTLIEIGVVSSESSQSVVAADAAARWVSAQAREAAARAGALYGAENAFAPLRGLSAEIALAAATRDRRARANATLEGFEAAVTAACADLAVTYPTNLSTEHDPTPTHAAVVEACNRLTGLSWASTDLGALSRRLTDELRDCNWRDQAGAQNNDVDRVRRAGAELTFADDSIESLTAALEAGRAELQRHLPNILEILAALPHGFADIKNPVVVSNDKAEALDLWDPRDARSPLSHVLTAPTRALDRTDSSMAVGSGP